MYVPLLLGRAVVLRRQTPARAAWLRASFASRLKTGALSARCHPDNLARFRVLFEAQVEILVDDGVSGGHDGSDDDTNVIVVEAGTLGTVTASAVLYDPRLGNSSGCDPDGCTAALTRVRKPTDSHVLPLALIQLAHLLRFQQVGMCVRVCRQKISPSSFIPPRVYVRRSVYSPRLPTNLEHAVIRSYPRNLLLCFSPRSVPLLFRCYPSFVSKKQPP